MDLLWSESYIWIDNWSKVGGILPELIRLRQCSIVISKYIKEGNEVAFAGKNKDCGGVTTRFRCPPLPFAIQSSKVELLLHKVCNLSWELGEEPWRCESSGWEHHTNNFHGREGPHNVHIFTLFLFSWLASVIFKEILVGHYYSLFVSMADFWNFNWPLLLLFCFHGWLLSYSRRF